MRQLTDYPIGIQVMFQQAQELLERLDKMETDYREWEESWEYTAWEATLEDDIIVEPPTSLAQLVAPSRPEAARLRWEAQLANNV